VPAAHLSFISNLTILPLLSINMTLISWPPISNIVLASGNKLKTPIA